MSEKVSAKVIIDRKDVEDTITYLENIAKDLERFTFKDKIKYRCNNILLQIIDANKKILYMKISLNIIIKKKYIIV